MNKTSSNLTPVPPASPSFTFQRGVNIGDAFETHPPENDQGVFIQEEYFDLIKDAGFDTVRLPVRWGAHTDKNAPHTIDPTFLARVDDVIGWALTRDLAVVINLHHYDRPTVNVTTNMEHLLSIWKQLSAHYKNYSPKLIFETYNEPDNTITTEQWNDVIGQTLATIRPENPTRKVIVGGNNWYGYEVVKNLDIPENDHNLIVTFHYYRPYPFTHQGAEWVNGSDAWMGNTWDASDAERAEISTHFDEVSTWASANNRPVHLGEFGAYSKADMASRARWMSFIREQAEARGFSWTYWEFCSGFGVYNRDMQQWNDPLLKALIP